VFVGWGRAAEDFAGLEVGFEEIPALKKGEVLVRLLLRPIHPTDLHTLAGTRAVGPHNLPFIAGNEVMGAFHTLPQLLVSPFPSSIFHACIGFHIVRTFCLLAPTTSFWTGTRLSPWGQGVGWWWWGGDRGEGKESRLYRHKFWYLALRLQEGRGTVWGGWR
jgi:hypothetical protein